MFGGEKRCIQCFGEEILGERVYLEDPGMHRIKILK
jgi:hypothetical protein